MTTKCNVQFPDWILEWRKDWWKTGKNLNKVVHQLVALQQYYFLAWLIVIWLHKMLTFKVG